jgi:hypothetical protein
MLINSSHHARKRLRQLRKLCKDYMVVDTIRNETTRVYIPVGLHPPTVGNASAVRLIFRHRSIAKLAIRLLWNRSGGFGRIERIGSLCMRPGSSALWPCRMRSSLCNVDFDVFALLVARNGGASVQQVQYGLSELASFKILRCWLGPDRARITMARSRWVIAVSIG